MKNNMLALIMAIILSSILINNSFVFADCTSHDAEATLSPEWSSPGNTEHYDVDIKNTGCYDITEVRIYKNDRYTNFVCDEKEGWNLVYMNTSTFEACFYYANDAAHYITPNTSQTFHFSADTPQDPECNLQWQFEARDTENWWNYLYDSTSVDETAPNINIDNDAPEVIMNGQTWIRRDTNIYLSVYDTGNCGVSGLDYCEMRILLDGNVLQNWTRIDWTSDYERDGIHYYNYIFNFNEDSEHQIDVRCYDIAGNEATESKTYRVDSTHPQTTLLISDPKYVGDNGATYVDTATSMTLSAIDPDPTGENCNIGIDFTEYAELYISPDDPNFQYCLNPDTYCNSDYLSSNMFGWGSWNMYEGGNIPKDEEGCLIIAYYSDDFLDNYEPMNYKCILVDHTKPSLDIITPDDAIQDSGEEYFSNPGNPDGDFYWVTSDMDIGLVCTDHLSAQHPSASGVDKICLNIKYDGEDVTESNYCSNLGGEMNDEGYCCVDATDNMPFYFNFNEGEDSKHILNAYCVDKVSKKSYYKEEYYKVDNTPPTINKEMFGIYMGDCPPQSSSDTCYLKGGEGNGIHVTATDEGECASDEVTCEWYYVWNGTESQHFEEADTFDITFNEDSQHDLTIVCKDQLGNKQTDTETFLVDMLPPETTLTYGEPHVNRNGVDYITSDTPVTLTAEDAKSGVDKTYWRVKLLNGNDACEMSDYCDPEYYNAYVSYSTDWNEYTDSFNLNEDSCHVIEYYSVDNLGNEETQKYSCVFVDNQAPEMNLAVGDPSVEKNNKTYISQQTPITLSCHDKDPHPVKGEEMYYRYRYSDDCENWNNWSEWISPIYLANDGWILSDIHMNEDSCHEIEYYCKDELGNENEHQTDTLIVDTQGPTITKTVSGPQYGDCPPQSAFDECYISTSTNITITAEDQDPHPVGDVLCSWSYIVSENNSINGEAKDVESPFTINFNEDSHHILSIDCHDALGNYNTDKETFVVDNKKPVIVKNYEGPYYSNGTSEWISSETLIHLRTYDQDPHPSGINTFKYRITQVDDKYCYNPEEYCDEAEGEGNWTIVDGLNTTTSIPEESCHLIEVISKDNVDNEEVHKQCVFVDNTEPLPNKTLGKPAEKWYWDEYGDVFYNVSGKCWNGENDSIDCWKLTTMTPVYLNCVDQGPHPVGDDKVCFNVGWDGDDLTEEYCSSRYYNGEYNETTGYCCIPNERRTFYFKETTYHKLSYYCVDKLGNQGPEDTEMFKVEESAFEIAINKKWNLISVPFRLLDNSLDKVFKDLNDSIKSVWTYNGTDWFVYTPDGDSSNDNMDTMLPGWGYWILATNETSLIVGGSLMQPALTPPEKKIVHGWNLIGYWGTEGMDGYYGPDGNGKSVGCELNSLDASYFDKSTAAVWGYWELYNPNTWYGLTWSDEMDPGAGYWMFYPGEEATYAPSTTCEWI